jgi:hypothetical protein
MENRDAARTALRTSLLEADWGQRLRAGIVLLTPIPENLGIQSAPPVTRLSNGQSS